MPSNRVFLENAIHIQIQIPRFVIHHNRLVDFKAESCPLSGHLPNAVYIDYLKLCAESAGQLALVIQKSEVSR